MQLMYIRKPISLEQSSSFNLSEHHQTKIPGKLNQVRSEMRSLRCFDSTRPAGGRYDNEIQN